MKKSALTLALAAALAGCSLAPDYQRPESGLPERWTPAALQADAGQVANVPAAELGWQGFFRDARLQQLIGIARLLLIAGHDTSANTMSLGVLALLQNPERKQALIDDPSLVNGAVEEILRFVDVTHNGRRRSSI